MTPEAKQAAELWKLLSDKTKAEAYWLGYDTGRADSDTAYALALRDIAKLREENEHLRANLRRLKRRSK